MDLKTGNLYMYLDLQGRIDCECDNVLTIWNFSFELELSTNQLNVSNEFKQLVTLALTFKVKLSLNLNILCDSV